ncbi:ankyrin repeat-containing domain protein [Nemania sp. FL0916]|nr:ankyrin repeat-containing domain protein [Nemania sp. FL0916]
MNDFDEARIRNGLDTVKLVASNVLTDIEAQHKINIALQAAVHQGDFRLVKFFLEKGADINADEDGPYLTALQAATDTKNLEMVAYLLDYGAHINHQDKNSETVLQERAEKGDLETVRFLVQKGADVNLQCGHSHTALQAAATRGSLDTVRFLVEQGADINLRGGYHNTALQAASVSGHLDTVKFLVERGADVDLQNGQSDTALQAAVRARRLEIINVLLNYGANVNLRGTSQQTALHYAVMLSEREIIRLLLDRNASLDAQDHGGRTPVDIAILNEEEGIIRMLLPRLKSLPPWASWVWRNALHFGPTSILKCTFGSPILIEEISEKETSWTGNRIEDMTMVVLTVDKKVRAALGTVAMARIALPQNPISLVMKSRNSHITSPSGFGSRWWRYEKMRWLLESSPLPSLDLCQRLDSTQFVVECWFSISCITITDTNWPEPQVSMPENYENLELVEGFYWVTARRHSDANPGDGPIENLVRSVFSATTCEHAPVEQIRNIGDLLVYMIDKVNRTFEENIHQANIQLSNSRFEVLRNAGGNESLIQSLLSDATVIERMTGNHGRIVQSLARFISHAESRQKGLWNLSGERLQMSKGNLAGFQGHREALRELLEKSQDIIQLEFNLASILEARKSTSTNRSLKRLTWVTFVFLPLLFVASLFGMNVDILANNPSWLWYFPVAGGFTLFTFTIWIVFKRFNTLEGNLEKVFLWLVGGDNSVGVKRDAAKEERKRRDKQRTGPGRTTGLFRTRGKKKRREVYLESGNSATAGSDEN